MEITGAEPVRSTIIVEAIVSKQCISAVKIACSHIREVGIPPRRTLRGDQQFESAICNNGGHRKQTLPGEPSTWGPLYLNGVWQYNVIVYHIIGLVGQDACASRKQEFESLIISIMKQPKKNKVSSKKRQRAVGNKLGRSGTNKNVNTLRKIHQTQNIENEEC